MPELTVPKTKPVEGVYELVFVGFLLLLLLTLFTVFTIILNGSKLKVGVYQVSNIALLPK